MNVQELYRKNRSQINRVAELLDCQFNTAIGHIIALFEFAQNECPDGNISLDRHGQPNSNAAIVAGMNIKSSDHTADEVIAALLEAKFIRSYGVHRLVIIDFGKYADEWVHQNLVKTPTIFADNTYPHTKWMNDEQRARYRTAFPNAPLYQHKKKTENDPNDPNGQPKEEPKNVKQFPPRRQPSQRQPRNRAGDAPQSLAAIVRQQRYGTTGTERPDATLGMYRGGDDET